MRARFYMLTWNRFFLQCLLVLPTGWWVMHSPMERGTVLLATRILLILICQTLSTPLGSSSIRSPRRHQLLSPGLSQRGVISPPI